MRVDSKDLEYARNQVGRQRKLPGGGAGGSLKWIGEAVARGDGGGDASHLPSEAEIVLGGADLVGMHHDDAEHAEAEGDAHHPWEGSADARPGSMLDEMWSFV